MAGMDPNTKVSIINMFSKKDFFEKEACPKNRNHTLKNKTMTPAGCGW